MEAANLINTFTAFSFWGLCDEGLTAPKVCYEPSLLVCWVGIPGTRGNTMDQRPEVGLHGLQPALQLPTSRKGCSLLLQHSLLQLEIVLPCLIIDQLLLLVLVGNRQLIWPKYHIQLEFNC